MLADVWLKEKLCSVFLYFQIHPSKKWGLGDSAEVSIRQFLSKDSLDKNKLFEKIISIELSVTQKELQDLIPVTVKRKTVLSKLMNQPFLI